MNHNQDGMEAPRVLLVYQKAASTFTAYPWLLAGSGRIRVDVLAPSTHPIRFSRWVDTFIGYWSNEDLIVRLEGILQDKQRYSLLHFADESSRDFVYTKLRDNPRFLTCLPFPVESGLIDACRDKVLFDQWCASHDLPAPKSQMALSRDLVKKHAGAFDFPFILKGSTGSRGSTVFKIENSAMLDDVLESCPGMERWLVQEYIRGAVGTTSFIASEGVVYAVTSLYKDVSLNGGLGPVAVARTVHNGRLQALAEKVARAAKITGITGFDWMEDSAGDYHIIDSHLGRAPANLVVSRFQGVAVDHALEASLKKEGGRHLPNQVECRVWLMPQMFVLFFEGRIREALRLGHPFKSGTTIFWFGKGEWRMFLHQLLPQFTGRARVSLGRLRRHFRRG